MFFLVTLYYLVFSHIQKLVFVKGQRFQLEQLLYWVIFAALAAMWFVSRQKERQPFDVAKTESWPRWLLLIGGARFVSRQKERQPFDVAKTESWPRWLLLIGGALAILATCTLISISSHEGIGGYHERF